MNLWNFIIGILVKTVLCQIWDFYTVKQSHVKWHIYVKWVLVVQIPRVLTYRFDFVITQVYQYHQLHTKHNAFINAFWAAYNVSVNLLSVNKVLPKSRK